jgi:hypothetical protein
MSIMNKCFLAAFTWIFAAAPLLALAAEPAETKAPAKVLRHVVLFKFKEGTSSEQLDKIVKAFAALPGKIDTIVDFEWGTDVGVENLANGFTHCFFVTFRDAKGRDAYLPHPAHQEFVTLVKPHLEKVLVVDYWTMK